LPEPFTSRAIPIRLRSSQSAGILLKNLEVLQKLQRTPQFKESLSNKSLRRGFGSHDAQWQLLKEIEAAKLKT
jgi:hypothetical protein